MKALANTLLIIGLMAFLASSALFVYHFATRGDATITDAVGMAATGALVCFAVFMRSRVRESIPILSVTEEDKTQFQEMVNRC